MAPEKSVFLLFTRRPTHRRMTISIQLNGEKIARTESHRFLGVKFDNRLDWGKHVREMIGSATPRINALKRLSAKSVFKYPDWVLKIHDAVINSIWKYGCIGYIGMSMHLWERLTRCHAYAVKGYCGIPKYVGYQTVCDALGLKNVRDDLMSFAKKRIGTIVSFSPFGRTLLENRRSNATGIYRSPTEVVFSDLAATTMSTM